MLETIIETKVSSAKPKNVLAGAIYIAIENAELFGTPLVIKGKNGRIREVTPAEMRRIVSRSK